MKYIITAKHLRLSTGHLNSRSHRVPALLPAMVLMYTQKMIGKVNDGLGRIFLKAKQELGKGSKQL